MDGTQSALFAPAAAFVATEIAVPSTDMSESQGGILLPVPWIFVWPNNDHELRQTAPRYQPTSPPTRPDGEQPGAWKKTTWKVDLMISVTDNASDEERISAFPVLLDAVRSALNLATIPTVITDPQTQKQSQVLSAGEFIDGEMFMPERTSSSESDLRYAYRLTTDVIEATAYP